MSTIKRNGALPSDFRDDRVEDKIGDLRRKLSEPVTTSPPPLPDSLPPAETPPPASPPDTHPSQRLDMLLGK